MNRISKLFSLILLISCASMVALRPGQKRGPEEMQAQTPMIEEILGAATPQEEQIEAIIETAAQQPVMPEPTPQEAQELEKKLDQAQREIAKGAAADSSPQKIAQAKSFIANARALLACYSPRFFGGKKCDESKKDRLKTDLRAQLPAVDTKLLLKLGLGATALATVIMLIWTGAKKMTTPTPIETKVTVSNPTDVGSSSFVQGPGETVVSGPDEQDKKALEEYAQEPLENMLEFLNTMIGSLPPEQKWAYTNYLNQYINDNKQISNRDNKLNRLGRELLQYVDSFKK